MTVQQVARQAGVSPHTVRYYARVGLLRPAGRRDNGYKEFTAREVVQLRFIRRAHRLGFTLAEVEQIMQQAMRRDSPCPTVHEIVRHRLEENCLLLSELSALVSRVERALAAWANLNDGVPDGDAVCALIESLSEV